MEGEKKTKPAIAIACACAMAALASCSGEYRGLYDLEGRTGKEEPGPAKVAEIEAAILKYKGVVEKKVKASDRVSYYYKMLGLAYMGRRMYGEAYKAYVEALAISPENSNLYYYAGLCSGYLSKAEIGLEEGSEARRGEYLAKAERAYRRSLDIEPDNVRTMYALGVLYAMELSRPDDAAPLIEAYVLRNSKDVSSRFLLASVRYAQGRYADALELYDQIQAVATLESERQAARENKEKVELLLGGGR